MNARIARSIAWFLVVGYIILSAIGLYLEFLSDTTPANGAIPLLPYMVAMIVVGVWPVIAAQIISHHPYHPVGWLLFVTFPVIAIVMFAIGYTSYATSEDSGLLPIPGIILFWLKDTGLPIAIVTLSLMYLMFPTGKFLSLRWRIAAWVSIGVLPLILGFQMIKPGPLPLFPSIDNPDAVNDSVWGALAPAYLATIVLLVLTSLAAVISLILRLKRAYGDEAQQIKWLVVPAAVYWIGIPLMYFGAFDSSGILVDVGVSLHLISVPVIVIAVAFAIFKYRLYDIDLIIYRSLVYGALMVSVVALYVAAVGVLSLVFQSQGNPIIALIATGLVAVLFQPLRESIQHDVNRLFYGRRDEPLKALSQLGKRLESAMAPEVVLPTLVETVAQTLRLPYVAISLLRGDDFLISAEVGKETKDTFNWPLIYQGKTIGHLIASTRGSAKAFNHKDHRLLENIAYQAGPSVYAVQLTQELRQSRVDLFTAREEERRRLRRDLHDGLGPVLASQGLKMAAVSQLLENEQVKAQCLLEELVAQNEATVADIRRLVYALRPAALDDLGLVGAIRDYASDLKGSSEDSARLHIDIQTPVDGLPTLPAAIEVTAYRIISEALTNIARHACARRATVFFVLHSRNNYPSLHLEIVDDGIGLPTDYKLGIGLLSMRERAEEVGGSFLVESPAGFGTRVVAELPLVAAT